MTKTIDPAYQSLKQAKIKDLPASSPWPKLVRQMIPPETVSDADLPELSVQQLMRAAALKLQMAGEANSAYAKRIGMPQPTLHKFLKSGEPLGPTAVRQLLNYFSGEEQPIEQLKELLEQAIKGPQIIQEKEWTDEEIGRHLGHMSGATGERAKEYARDIRTFRTYFLESDSAIATSYRAAIGNRPMPGRRSRSTEDDEGMER